MRVVLDTDLQVVLEFMQAKVPASKLVGVASALHDIAPILWGRYEGQTIQAIDLEPEPFSTSCEKPQVATV